jgi:hypothetical protein
MEETVRPSRGLADNPPGSKKPLVTIGSSCSKPIMARRADAAPQRGRRYDCRRDPPFRVLPPLPIAGNHPGTQNEEGERRERLNTNAPRLTGESRYAGLGTTSRPAPHPRWIGVSMTRGEKAKAGRGRLQRGDIEKAEAEEKAEG